MSVKYNKSLRLFSNQEKKCKLSQNPSKLMIKNNSFDLKSLSFIS